MTLRVSDAACLRNCVTGGPAEREHSRIGSLYIVIFCPHCLDVRITSSVIAKLFYVEVEVGGLLLFLENIDSDRLTDIHTSAEIVDLRSVSIRCKANSETYFLSGAYSRRSGTDN